jgi:hypothetical protein
LLLVGLLLILLLPLGVCACTEAEHEG